MCCREDAEASTRHLATMEDNKAANFMALSVAVQQAHAEKLQDRKLARLGPGHLKGLGGGVGGVDWHRCSIFVSVLQDPDMWPNPAENAGVVMNFSNLPDPTQSGLADDVKARQVRHCKL